MSSLKEIQQNTVRRKQVYKPILDNPFTDEAHMWPYVRDQPLVAELVRSHVIEPLAHAHSMKLQSTLNAHYGFNSVVQYLESPPTPEPVFLFVCNRDSVPGVLLSQIPILVQVSSCDVTLIPMPRGTCASLDTCTSTDHDGLLLVVQDGQFDPQIAVQLSAHVDHVTTKPWLQFSKSRIAALSSTAAISSNPKLKSK
ncbi:LAQU0S03e07580g1_1 [Lachancea quebecensis]|uniref:LAQU0S03e07580g1_1 n=1 Tax=Lachancea quebecensis TaxID=1654605 RepID=A0A0P1KNN0_9SACH|nr:LAQU0S03e07580g1_1 [Lachancea quebecensis]